MLTDETNVTVYTLVHDKGKKFMLIQTKFSKNNFEGEGLQEHPEYNEI